MNKKSKFENYIHLIDIEINKRKNKWTLSALKWINFDDVSQIIRIHLFKKWDKYDDTKPLLPWVNTIISNQIRNIIRNNYGNYTRPCLKCAAAQGETGCRIYKEQCAECPLYKIWAKSKQNAYHLKMAVSIEDHSFEINNQSTTSPDLEKGAKNLHVRMKILLKPIEWRVYEMLYIKHKTEEFVCKALKFKYNAAAKTTYNKQLKNIQKAIIEKARECLNRGEVDL